jgi:Subunit 11 of the general transcription factor TFIIH
LDKLDRCFYTLITGLAVDSSTPLSPAFEVYKMNTTEKVRLKSVIERTRLHVITLAEGGNTEPDPPTESVPDIGERDTHVDAMDEDPMEEGEDEDEDLEIMVAKVYDRSLVEVGESLKRDG